MSQNQNIALDLLLEAAQEGELAGRRFKVRGGCMWPLIEDGDEVQLAAHSTPLRPGQIVLARVGTGLLCHRLLEISETTCRVAGDQDLRLDELPLADLVGRVEEIRKQNGSSLKLPAEPSRLERWLAAWHLWSCRRRRYLHRLLEIPRRALQRWKARRHCKQTRPTVS